MSILAYVGLPGSGKSYDVVANQILPALKQGRHVCTNIPLHKEKISQITTSGTLTEFPTEKIQTTPEAIFEYCTAGTVLVLDEVWRLFPAGLKANNVPEPFRKLLAEHRHMVNENGDSTQIVLVTQDLAQISAFARQLVEQTFNHTKLTSIGAAKSYRIDIYAGAVTGTNPPKQQRIREIYGTYNNSITSLYQSHTMSQSKDGSVNEKGADSRGNIFKRPIIWAGLVGIILTFAIAIPMVKKQLQPKGTAVPVGERSESPVTASPTQGDLHPLQAQSAYHSCMRHVTSNGIDCRCIDSTGTIQTTGAQCIDYMNSYIGNFGGPGAKADNIAYLNSHDQSGSFHNSVNTNQLPDSAQIQ